MTDTQNDRITLSWPFIVLADGLAVLYNVLRHRNLGALRGRLAAVPGLRQMWRNRSAPCSFRPLYMRPLL
jgi:hypothetical protein